MINIFVVSNTLELGGAEKQSVLLANGLATNYKVSLIVYYGDRVNQRLLEKISENVTLVRLYGSQIKRLTTFFSLIKTNNVKYLFSSLATSNVICGIARFTKTDVSIIGSIRNCTRPFLKSGVELLLHKYLHDHTVFNNHTGYNHYVNRGYDCYKCSVIPNCIEQIPEYYERKHSKPVRILSVSRFVPQKDITTMLKAITHLKHKMATNEFRITIAGFGPEEGKIRAHIKNNQLSDVANVAVNPDVSSLYASSDLFLSTSIREGTSNTIMEAMSCGLPVVCTDAGDNSRLVTQNMTGFVAPIGDYGTISDYLYELINNPKKRVEFGREGRRLVSTEYSTDKFIRSYRTLIESSLNTRIYSLSA
jgi:glycosyltransferase involved in cell wall biosynthesis